MIISQKKIDDLEVYEIILDCLSTAMKTYERTKDPGLLKTITTMYEENEKFKKEIDTKEYVA